MSGSLKSFLEMFCTVMCLWGAVSYVLTALSHHRIARRRGLSCGWLAWVPLGNVWLLGRLSDQYQWMAAGRRTKRAATLVTLTIFAAVVLALAAVILGSVGAYLSESRLEPGSLLGLILGIMLLIAGAGLCLARQIVGYVADYSIYNSCKPENAKAFVVLSIFFQFLKPFFRISCSGYDAGFGAAR